jgi:tape measure domain-containing protein
MSTISTTVKINDAFSNPLDRLSSGLQKAQSGMSKLKEAISGGSSGGSMFKSMVGGTVVGGAINKGMELASTGIRSMYGELDEASKAWQTFDGNMHQLGKSPAEIATAKKSMQQFAQQTIYGASDMASTYSQLAAVGTKNVDQLVRGFGGLAAASSNPQQAMKTLSEQATQMAAKPMVQWQDFKLMLEQTPAGISAVAKTMGVSTQQLIKNVQDGKVKT